MTVKQGFIDLAKGVGKAGSGLCDILKSSYDYFITQRKLERGAQHYFRLFGKSSRKYFIGSLPILVLATWLGLPNPNKDRETYTGFDSGIERFVDNDSSSKDSSFYDEEQDKTETIHAWSKYSERKHSERLIHFKPQIKESNLEAVVKRAFGGSNIPLGLSLINKESSFIPDVVSDRFCVGLTQLSVIAANEVAPDLGGAEKGYWQINYPIAVEDKNGKKVTYNLENPCPDPAIDWRFDYRKSVYGGAAYLKKLTRQFGSLNTALAAYNWGPGNVQRIVDNLKETGIKRPKFDKDIYPALPGEVKYFVEFVRGTEEMYKAKFPLDKYSYHSSDYGLRKNPFGRGKKFHQGNDFAAPEGTPVHNMVSGKVIFAGRDGGNGKTVKVKHDNSPYISMYNHLENIKVREGSRVSKGKVVGTVGETGLATGPHLDLKVYRISQRGRKHSMDVMSFFNRETPSYSLGQ